MGLRGHLPDVKLHPRDPGGMGRPTHEARLRLLPTSVRAAEGFL